MNRNMMEKKQTYQTPAVRETDLRFEACFLQSAGGTIDPWNPDDDPINF